MIERLGAESFAYLKGADFALTVKADGDAALSVGDHIAVAVTPTRAHLFDAQGVTLTDTNGDLK